jgi:hypothetical protein
VVTLSLGSLIENAARSMSIATFAQAEARRDRQAIQSRLTISRWSAVSETCCHDCGRDGRGIYIRRLVAKPQTLWKYARDG